MTPWDKDVVFMQNSFDIKTKDGKIINKKFDLLVSGNHYGTKYSATALLVAFPTAITAQVYNYDLLNLVNA